MSIIGMSKSDKILKTYLKLCNFILFVLIFPFVLSTMFIEFYNQLFEIVCLLEKTY